MRNAFLARGPVDGETGAFPAEGADEAAAADEGGEEEAAEEDVIEDVS